MTGDSGERDAVVDMERQQDVLILGLGGRFGDPASLQMIRAAFEEAASANDHKVLVDVVGCSFLSAEAIAHFASLLRAVKAREGELKVSGLQGNYACGPGIVFKRYATRAEAISAFSAGE